MRPALRLRNLLVVITALFLVTLTGFVILNNGNKTNAAPGDCTVITRYPDGASGPLEWNQGDYHYIIWEVGAQGTAGNALLAETDAGQTFDTENNDCNPTISATSMRWVAGNDQLPVAAYIGVPASLGHPNNGNWGAAEINPPQPEPIGVFGRTYGRPAAIVDDAARIKVGTTTLLCVAIAPDCPEDITNRSAYPNGRNGAGALFIKENCPGELNAFQCQASEDRFISTKNSNKEITDLFTKLNGSLDSLRLRIKSTNTHEVGWRASLFITMQYPRTYNNVPSIEAFTSSAAGCPKANRASVKAGDTICLEAGMSNVGNSDPGQTFVELDASHPQYITPVSILPPTNGDPYVGGVYHRGYDNNRMANGDTEWHHWWERTNAPRTGAPYWSVQYAPVKFTVNAGTPDGTNLCFRTIVSRATPSQPYAIASRDDGGKGREVCFGVGTVPDLEPCPAPALPNGNPLIDVDLPDQAPNSPLAPNLPFTGTRADRYEQNTRQGKTKVTGINDISTGGLPVTPDLVTDATYQKATLNYSPYVREYPFDNNKPSVTYDSYYTQVVWTSSSSPDFWVCDDGTVSTDATCEYVHDAVCPSGWDGPSGGQCTKFESYDRSCSRYSGTGANRRCVAYPACASGYSEYGSACYRNRSQSSYCEHSGNDTWYIDCLHQYTGTPMYNWRQSQPATLTRSSTTTNTYQQTPCYNRAYDATPTSADGQLDDDENPTNASFTGSINVAFSTAEPSKGRTAMRQASKVDLPYTISYTIEHADGTSSSVSDVNRSTMINANSTNKTSSGGDNVSYSFGVSIPGNLRVGDRVCWVLYTTRRSGTSQTTGQMDINGNIRSGSGQRQASDCTSRVVNQPYTRVYGADVMSGSGFGNCTPNTNAGILGWNKGNGAGSGTQLAAQAAGTITGFSSASLRGVAPSPPRGLSFANVSGTYGGNYGAGVCVQDYFSLAKPSQISTSYPSSESPLNIAPGSRTVVYVEGDAFIRRNIVFSGGSWANLSQIPSYYLIVKGNIYISANVTQLDGVYIAQPTSPTSTTTGRIYTCVDHNTRAVKTTSPSAFTDCGQKLTVNGVFLAKQLRLLRTNGSLRDSTVGEPSTSGTIAEVFNYSPELFLIDPGLTTTPSRQYDAASALPPVL